MSASTPRVTVQRLQRTDGDALIAANRENVTYHAPWVTPFTDAGGFDAHLAKLLTGSNVSLVGREPRTDDLVGVFNLNEIVMGVFRSAYLGYWGYARTGGRGLVTEALGQVARYAFDELGLHRIEANIQPANTRSVALVKRAGFHLEGFSPRYLFIAGAWRDHERWTLLADAENQRSS
jgi:ribosomal-protein-alanine N-acetyltransferase